MTRTDPSPRTSGSERLPSWLAPLTRWPAEHLVGIAWTNLVLNMVIVLTGGAVRLTGSGLGCPTWPRCTPESLVPHSALGIHGAIEFGNRMITWVLTAAAILLLLAALGHGVRRVTRLAVLVALGIPIQAILGGITVLTGLNPWLVAGHLLVSMAIISVCVVLLDVLVGPARQAASGIAARLPVLLYAVLWLALALGTVVTGSGPHSGDPDSIRTGFDLRLTAELHALSVWLLVALTIGLVVVARRGRHETLAKAATALLGVELLQGMVGYAQYFLHLPALLVGVHMALAATLAAVGTATFIASRRRS